jgi:hypothetical protein
VTFIETVLLAFPEFDEEDELTLDLIKPYWTCLEQLVDSEIVLAYCLTHKKHYFSGGVSQIHPRLNPQLV